MAIINNFNHPVIKADNRDAWVSFANHIARGSRGGVDLAYPYGTPIYAPTDGVGSYYNNGGKVGLGSGGNMYALHCAEGTIEFMHLSAGGVTGPVHTGDYIGLSGASGYGKLKHYDQHLHVDIETPNGRRNLWDYFTATVAKTSKTLITEQEENEMEMFLHMPSGAVCHFSPRGMTQFADEAEYDTYRAVIINYNQNTPDSTMTVPPEQSKVVGVTWETYDLICKKFIVSP